MPEERIDEAVLDRLVELGREADGPAIARTYKDLEKNNPERNAEFRHAHPKTLWEGSVRRLDASALDFLIRGLVLAIEYFGWDGGSVSGPMWLYPILARMDAGRALGLSEWIIQHTGNSYAADFIEEYARLNRDNLMARAWGFTDEDLQRWKEERTQEWLIAHARELLQPKERPVNAEDFESLREQQESQRHRLRMEAHRDASQARRETLESLASLDIEERLLRVAHDSAHPPHWYPGEWAQIDDPTLASLSDRTRTELLKRLRDMRSKRGKWSRLLTRLERSLKG